MIKEKPWLKSYETHVPEHIDYPNVTVVEAMEETATNNPNFPSLIFKDTLITYKEQLDAANRLAAALQNLGVKKGDRVLYGKYSGTEVSIEGEEYLIMRESDIFAVIVNS